MGFEGPGWALAYGVMDSRYKIMHVRERRLVFGGRLMMGVLITTSWMELKNPQRSSDISRDEGLHLQ